MPEPDQIPILLLTCAPISELPSNIINGKPINHKHVQGYK